ncbi:MAG: aspartate/glutamate racemase family protein [Anaerolineae bacterium]
METKRLVLVHTVSPLLEVFNRLGAELLPGVQLLHILDEPIIERVRQRGQLAPEDSARLGTHVAIAESSGAHAVLVTCSTISPCVDDVRPGTNIPVIKIDEAMISKAVTLGTKIGVVATNVTTLEPTRQLLEAQARSAGKDIDIELVLVENALPALLSGDGATHDKLVKEAVLKLAQRVDVVVLAQATMARVLDVIPAPERKVPILSSPHLAIERVRDIIEATQ